MRSAQAARELLDEVADQGRDVLGALAQRRKPEWKHVQAVVEIAPEGPLADHLRRGPGSSRRPGARRRVIVREPPRRSNSCSCSTRSSFGWSSSGMSPTSSRNSVPPFASSKRPTRCAIAPVNAPRSCPKSSLSSSPVGMAAQLTLTKVRRASRAQVVDGARDQLLARARLAHDEDRRVRRGDGLDLLQHAPQRPRVADDLLEVVLRPDLLLEVDVLRRDLVLELGDPLERERVLDREGDLVGHGAEQLGVLRREGLAAEPADVQRAEPVVANRQREAAHRRDALGQQPLNELAREPLEIGALEAQRLARREGRARGRPLRRHEGVLRRGAAAVELERAQLEGFPLDVVEREAGVLVRHDAPQHPGDSAEQRAQLEVGDERVVHLEQQPQAIPLSRQLVLGMLRVLLMQGVVDRQRDVRRELPQQLDVGRRVGVLLPAREAERAEASQRRGERNGAERPHSLGQQERGGPREARLALDARHDHGLLGLPGHPAGRIQDGQLGHGHDRAMERGHAVEAHRLARRVVQHDRQAVAGDELLQQRSEVAEQRLERVGRRRPRHLEQSTLEIGGAGRAKLVRGPCRFHRFPALGAQRGSPSHRAAAGNRLGHLLRCGSEARSRRRGHRGAGRSGRCGCRSARRRGGSRAACSSGAPAARGTARSPSRAVEAGALELAPRTRARTPHSSTCTPRALQAVEEALEQREADGVGVARALHAQHEHARLGRRRGSSIAAKCCSSAAVAPKNISPSRPKIRMRAHGASSGRRSCTPPSARQHELGEQHAARRAAPSSRNDMKTPIRTQNSIEIATAEIAVAATIAASKRVARRW